MQPAPAGGRHVSGAGCVSLCFDRIKLDFVKTLLMLEASNSLVIREISMVN
jgi:hypothetical protein